MITLERKLGVDYILNFYKSSQNSVALRILAAPRYITVRSDSLLWRSQHWTEDIEAMYRSGCSCSLCTLCSRLFETFETMKAFTMRLNSLMKDHYLCTWNCFRAALVKASLRF